MGWQTMLADLALILFMVSAAAMAEGPDKPKPSPPKPAQSQPAQSQPAPQGDPARSEPLAVWRDGVGAPDLGAWLTAEQPDARQQLTITLRYAPQDQAAALARGGALAQAAGKAKVSPRIILEPVAQASSIEAVAALAYDRGA
jgi:hypothetical protein